MFNILFKNICDKYLTNITILNINDIPFPFPRRGKYLANVCEKINVWQAFYITNKFTDKEIA